MPLCHASVERGEGKGRVGRASRKGEWAGQARGTRALRARPKILLQVTGCSRTFRLLTLSLNQDWHPSFGYVNNCDGGRSHSFCDYRQA
jgi:hypothetical protein